MPKPDRRRDLVGRHDLGAAPSSGTRTSSSSNPSPRSHSTATLAEIGTLADRYLTGRARLLEDRIRRGCVVDGHGDLLADDIYCLDDGPRVLDCLEFDDRLRWGDVLYDVGFLAMDLERLGRPDLAQAFMALVSRVLGRDAP